MESEFYCPNCKSGHDSPADARFGRHVLCLECALEIDFAAYQAEIISLDLDRPNHPPIAA